MIKDVIVKDAGSKGLGIFALRDFVKGEEREKIMDTDLKQLVESGYDRIAQRYLEFAQCNLAREKSSARMTYLHRLLECLPKQAESLELGCGAGVPCTQLLAQHGHVTGVDISAAQIALARQYVSEATLIQADMMSLAFPSASFDAVVAFYSIIHLPRTEQTILIKRIAAWLRPGGWLLANLGISNDPGSIEPDWLGTAMYWSSYDAQTNRDLVSQAGFTLAEAEILIDDEDGKPVSFLWILAKKELSMSTGETQKEHIADLYHRVAPAYGQVGPNFFVYAGQHLVERSALTEGARVLDVGAGRGANLFPAAEAVGPHGQVVGIDLAPGMVQETTAEIGRRNLSHVTMLLMDAEHMTFPDASFDYALCGFAIFLFPHLEQALSEFFRVLRPGGRMGVTVAQDLDALSHWFGERLTSYHQRYQFPLRAGGGKGGNYVDLPHYLTQAGFVDIEVLQEQADFVYTDAQEWWDARWTHGPRYALEHMEPSVLEQFKAEVFDRLAQEAQSHDIHETLRFQYILASK